MQVHGLIARVICALTLLDSRRASSLAMRTPLTAPPRAPRRTFRAATTRAPWPTSCTNPHTSNVWPPAHNTHTTHGTAHRTQSASGSSQSPGFNVETLLRRLD